MKVAYLGPEASYTHQLRLPPAPSLTEAPEQATIKTFSHTEAAYELIPRTTIEDVFAAVHNGDTDLAVVPFENSSNGTVVPTLDLFVNQSGKHSDIIIVEDIYLSISHCVLGRKAPNDTRSTTSHVRKVYSHPQAWGQCKQFLVKSLAGVERQDVSSTSRAAEIAASDPAGTSAAISSKLAAELNGLDILAESIEDNKDNTTRFLVLQRASLSTPEKQQPHTANLSYKTMISITVNHIMPGALADALAVFKQHSLTLTSINSRPSGQRNWMYVFFIEFKGHKDDTEVKSALDDLQKATQSYRWLGSWKDALTGI